MWHNSVYSYEFVIRKMIIDSNPTSLFAFSMIDAIDASQANAGDLFKQDNDFFIAESECSEVKRSGPTLLSPNRCFGTLYISLYTKQNLSAIANQQKLEQFSSMFSDKTIEGIRFRAYQPFETMKLLGFNRYSGSIQFNFEFIKE